MLSRLAAFILLATIPAAAAENKIVRHADKIPEEYLVLLTDDVSRAQVHATVQDIVREKQVVVHEIWVDAVKGFFARMTEKEAEKIAKDDRVTLIEENARWYLSATQATNVDPSTCTGTCTTVVDNRLWHLDRIDQNTAAPTNQYVYENTGSGRTVYVIDTGVFKDHIEFAGSNRVIGGKNTSGDFMPQDNPCMGAAVPPSGDLANLEQDLYRVQVDNNGHGTAVASLVGGAYVGVARGVTIIPIKVWRCDRNSARARRSSQLYQQYQTMFRSENGSSIDVYRASNTGTTAAVPAPNASWHVNNDPNGPLRTQFQDEGVLWQLITDYTEAATTTMLVSGLNWILSSENTGPKTKAVVSISGFRKASETDASLVNTAITSLLQANMIVVASANNGNGDACDTSPAVLSANSPNKNASYQYDVITVGGSMLINRPWTVSLPTGVQPADGYNPAVGTPGVEPAHNSDQAVRDGRWICGKGDTAPCGNTQPTDTKDPASLDYGTYLAGSNAGPCVTLFAPAKNLTVASITATNSYRDNRVRNGFTSGTSWAAPIVSGVIARILQVHNDWSPTQVRDELLLLSESVLDTTTLNTKDHNGNWILDTPNELLRISNVTIGTHPASVAAAPGASTPLSVTATGTGLLYQWYEVNSSFDYATYKRGADHTLSAAPVSGTTSTFNAENNGVRRAYFARITNPSGSADTDIAVVVPPPSGAPTNATATATTTSVLVQWAAGTGAERYELQRKTNEQDWARVGTLLSTATLSATDVPSAPDGPVAYRVRSVAGLAYLPDDKLAASASNIDISNVRSYLYEALPVPPPYVTIKAQHFAELRLAVNALHRILNVPPPYTSAETQASALLGQAVTAQHLITLMERIDAARLQLGMAMAFSNPPTLSGIIQRTLLLSLRAAFE